MTFQLNLTVMTLVTTIKTHSAMRYESIKCKTVLPCVFTPW